MILAQIITPWAQDSDGLNVPQLAQDYTLLKWVDVSEQAAAGIVPNMAPNTVVIEAITTADTYADIENDNNYHVLWSAESE